MKTFWIVLMLLLLAGLINWVRGEADGSFPVVQTLPFLGGKPASWLWDGAALVMIGIVLTRLRKRESQ